MIAPDLPPGVTCSHSTTPSIWHNLRELERDLYVCLVTLHKIVKTIGDGNENRMPFLYHQASAARQLQQMIQSSNTPYSDPHLFEITNMFVYSQIQESAYGAWRNHLEGAKALIRPWAESTFDSHNFALYNVIMVDIYGTTMAPSKLLSGETVTQHLHYLALLGPLKVDILSTLTPVPAEMLHATIAINIFRAAIVSQSILSGDNHRRNSLSLGASLAFLQCFDPHHWLSKSLSVHASPTANWVSLTSCFQTATILYLFRSHE
jgi:hypothetical protein